VSVDIRRTLRYGKFAHADYRGVALLKFAIEKRQPEPAADGSE
jgi:citrate/tricarballylate utilization protein